MYILATSPISGGLYLLLLFFLCAAGVIGFRFALLQTRKKRNVSDEKKEKPAPEQKETPPQNPKAVYYIVEKKRARPKSSYSEPKKIRFD